MSWLTIWSFWFHFLFSLQTDPTGLFKTVNGTISFKSDAPLETISATSESLKGVIDTSTMSFAFSVPVRTFIGFNSKLQQEHFNENYMETARFPNATFTGKIIEEVNFKKPGITAVRAKGALSIHGVKQERLIKARIEVVNEAIIVNAVFMVALIDHEISVPRVVQQKISPEIEIVVSATLKPMVTE